MILWFGKKKKQQELKDAGAAMEAPELSAGELAAQEAEIARKAAEQEEIERKVAEANRAWEERQAREAAAAAEEAAHLEDKGTRRNLVQHVVCDKQVTWQCRGAAKDAPRARVYGSPD